MAFAAHFAQRLVRWQRRHGRHDLPWQGTTDPYRIWLSEVMLQQTQVATVVPYYRRFLEKYPSVHALARASEEEVLELWSGLGYYARGRNLHKAAKRIAAGGFPKTATEIEQLPGVGRSTAAAIAAFAYGERAAILDGNVKRVLARSFLLTDKQAMWRQAQVLLPRRNIESYTQALMDLGATLCTRVKPRCEACPVAQSCQARKTGRIGEFPPARKARVLPQRETTWLVLRRNGAVLVERRPSPGIWGGLWCFPELDGKAPKGATLLPSIEHGFTHFRLRIRPLLCKSQHSNAPAGRWLKIKDAEKAALPAPVKTLLARLREEEH
jgi:A/G-specific adenine glycosylase